MDFSIVLPHLTRCRNRLRIRLILSLVVFGVARVFAVTGRLVVGLGAFLGRFGIKLGLIVGLAVLVDGLGIVLILVFRRILASSRKCRACP